MILNFPDVKPLIISILSIAYVNLIDDINLIEPIVKIFFTALIGVITVIYYIRKLLKQ